MYSKIFSILIMLFLLATNSAFGYQLDMSVDEEKLKGADLDSLQGYMGNLSHKANFLASRVSDNASAQAESISNRYDAYGNIFSQGTSRYDYFG